MALTWNSGYWTAEYWQYNHPGTTGIAVRSSHSTSGSLLYRMTSSDKWNWVEVSEGWWGTEYWIYHNGGDNWWWWGWSATNSSGYNYFSLAQSSYWVDGWWSGTAWAYYYYPNAGSTTYTRQASSSRTSSSFTLRSSPGSNTVNGASTNITLTVNYGGNGTANATQTGTYYTQTVYTFSGWDEKTSASAPSSLTAGTTDYAAGASRSSTSDLYYYADYTSSSSTKYTNNTKSLGTPTKASTSTTYTVTYAANGGSVSPTSATAKKTTTYTFSKWTPSNTNITVSSSNVATFKATGTVTASYTSSTGAVGTVTLPTPTRSGYTFQGWLAPNGSTYAAGVAYRPSSTAETLTAQWKQNAVTLTLTNSAGWTDSTYGPKGGGSYVPGTSVTVTQAVKTGWHFVNWTNSSGTSLSTSTSYTFNMPSSATTYTANVARNTYTIVYNANGGVGTTANSSHQYGVGKALTSNGYTKLGYAFQGWADTLAKANAGTVVYTNGQSVTSLSSTHNATVTLYAVWKPYTNMYIYTSKKDGTAKWVPALKYVYTSK